MKTSNFNEINFLSAIQNFSWIWLCHTFDMIVLIKIQLLYFSILCYDIYVKLWYNVMINIFHCINFNELTSRMHERDMIRYMM